MGTIAQQSTELRLLWTELPSTEKDNERDEDGDHEFEIAIGCQCPWQ